jgi:hypothetical protein
MVDSAVCDIAVPETRARLSKATFCWTIFRFLRKQNHNVPRPTIATNAIPPTTPPAIAPALDFELAADEELADAVVDGVSESETLVLVVIADEVVELSLASDQGFNFHRSQPNILHLLCSAAAASKLLFVYKENFIPVFFKLYYQIHLPGLS